MSVSVGYICRVSIYLMNAIYHFVRKCAYDETHSSVQNVMEVIG